MPRHPGPSLFGTGDQLALSPSWARRVLAEPRGERFVEAPLIVPPSTASEVMASESGVASTAVTWLSTPS